MAKILEVQTKKDITLRLSQDEASMLAGAMLAFCWNGRAGQIAEHIFDLLTKELDGETYFDHWNANFEGQASDHDVESK